MVPIFCDLAFFCNRKVIQTLLICYGIENTLFYTSVNYLNNLSQDRPRIRVCSSTLLLESTARTSWVSRYYWSGISIILFDLSVPFISPCPLQNTQIWSDFYSGFADLGIKGLKKKTPRIQYNRTLLQPCSTVAVLLI